MEKKEVMLKILKRTWIPLICLAFVLLLFFSAKSFFLKSSYFKIKEVYVRDKRGPAELGESKTIGSVKGKNIFSLNIKEISKALKANFPELRHIAVKRVMPDKIEIAIEKRIPVAIIKYFQNFPIDEYAVVLPAEYMVNKDLPMLSGIPIWLKPKVGEVLRSKRIDLALALLENVNTLKLPAKYELRKVELSNTSNVSLYLLNGLEVRIGQGNFKERLKMLSKILDDKKIDVDNLEYIDLRFKDVILGPK